MKVYLAGYETAYSSYKVTLPKDYNVFCTYYYKKNTQKALDFLKPNGHTGLITIDSGAHSFFGMLGISVTSRDSDKKKAIPDPNVYFQDYKKWLVENKDKLDYFCELDIQEILGMKKILGWREELKELGLAKKAIYVWHRDDGFEAFERLLDTSESGYIAVEGLKKNKEMLDYKKLLRHAYDKGIKVHGFAFTKCDLLHEFPFYSVDSSTWINPIKFGAFAKMINGKMRTMNLSDKDHFLKNSLDTGLHSKLRGNDRSKYKLELSADEYNKFEKHLTKVWKARGVNWKD